MNINESFVVTDMSQLDAFERARIDNSCDSFFLQVSRKKNAMSVFNKLKEVTGLPSRYDPEIWMYVTAVGKTLKGAYKGIRLTFNDCYRKDLTRVYLPRFG